MFDEIGNVLGITSTKNGRRRFYYYTNKKGYSLPMGQFDDVVLENIQKILEADLKGILAEDIREGLKFIPKIKFEDTCHIIEKGICSREGKINKIAVYIDVARLREFAGEYQRDSNFIRRQFAKNDGGISLSYDGKYLILDIEFVLDNSRSTKLRATCSKNIVMVSKMNETLVRGIAYGWKFAKEMEQGKTAVDLEGETGLQRRTIYRYVNLKYLSPKIVKDIFENRNPKNIRLVELMDLADNYDFSEQERMWSII